ncbi:hypothetical protein IV203_010056 [Nitzschia inconspicua]|uniref:Uncharacterized protein n=1 Tax=Nitzschia inconspicua TaxID=303405 RepID=A0A9K3PL18_9STRA|nr:hypothetical protein IV203_010056 [Nitzschia inconspicua]
MSSPAEKLEDGVPHAQAVAITGLQPAPSTPGAAPATFSSHQGLPMHQQEKQGSKCCGSCCDMRRAVIIIAIIFICATVLTLILEVTAAAVPGFNNVDDDQVEEILTSNTTRNIIVSAISLVMAIVALLGARFYNIWMLGLVVVWFVVSYAVGIYFAIDNINQVNNLDNPDIPDYRNPIGLFIFNAIITGLWIYPHVGLIIEIKKGIMSPQTYPREEYSCCCIDKRRTYQ